MNDRPLVSKVTSSVRGVRPTFCYTITGDRADRYPLMTCVSAAFLRQLYPDAHIKILLDEVTEQHMDSWPSVFHDTVDSFTVVQTRCACKTTRSRYVKTSIRQHVEGPLVFLDADTVPLRRFDPLFSHRASFAAVQNRSFNHPRPGHRGPVDHIFKHFGWDFPNQYFNSGVFYLDDTQLTRRFGMEWHQRWQDQVKAFPEVKVDQPSFNSSLYDLRVPVKEFGLKFNAMLQLGQWVARGARIVHHYASLEQAHTDTQLGYQMERLLATGQLDRPAMVSAIEYADPWTDSCQGIQRSLITGRYLNVMRIVLSRLVRTRST